MSEQLAAKGRDAYFDNAKAILITCVVLGHTLAGMLGEVRWIDSLYMTMYLFHMPVFVFVTGYYSRVLRTKKDWWKLVKTVVIPYFVCQFLYTAYYIYVLDFNVEFNLFEQSRWGLWFLVSLFCWRVMLPLFTRSKWMIAVALVIALVAGELPFVSEPFSLSRTLYFFVFFIAGYHLSVERVKCAGHAAKLASAAVLLVFFGVMYYLNDTSWKEWLFARLPYAQIEPLLFTSGMLNRLVMYGASLVTTIAFLVLIPTKHFRWTVIGQRTMAIYIFHLAAVQTFRELPIYEQWLQQGQYVYFFIFALLTVLLFTHPFFSHLLAGNWRRKA